ncbi:MAG: hypothetical protein ABSB35_42365 [Bryobacteraceae bacterium]|jgi:hypothetical protein
MASNEFRPTNEMYYLGSFSIQRMMLACVLAAGAAPHGDCVGKNKKCATLAADRIEPLY